MLIPPESSSAVQQVCVYLQPRFHARRARANSGKIAISEGVPFFYVLVRGESPNPVSRNLLAGTTDSTQYYGENPDSLSYLCLVWYTGCDRQRDGQNYDR